MTKEQFEELLCNSIKNFVDSYINHSDYPDKPHKFSVGYERNIKKLIQTRFSMTSTALSYRNG